MLVFIEHSTRRMHLGGVTANPTGEWTVQQARNLALSLDQRFEDIQVPDPRPRVELHRLVRRHISGSRHQNPGQRRPGTPDERDLRAPRRHPAPRSPRPDVILGQAHLRAVIMEYQTHYNTARPHQGIAQHVPDADRDIPRATVTDLDTARIHRRPVLGGLINEYTHAA
jgi:putative transposase